MMNITVVSLITSMITHSPAYVGNHLSMKRCHFQKFSSLLFFNQKYLYVKDTTFQHGLNGVIRRDSLINSSLVDDPQFNTINSTTFIDETFNKDPIIFDPAQLNSVFTIINCMFYDIKFKEGLITIKKASFYLTESTFANCDGVSKTIWLDQSRCNTISHICSTNVTVESGSSFVDGNGVKTDFFILLYSTIVGKSTDSINGRTPIYAQYGHQYHRCLNLTNLKTEVSIIQYQNPIHFSQRFITFEKIKDCNLIEFSSFDINATCEMINAARNISISDDYSLVLFNALDVQIDITFNKCIFITDNHKPTDFISKKGNVNKVSFMLIDCSFDKSINIQIENKEIQTSNVIITDASDIKTLDLPHYTKQGYCLGNPKKHLSKKGCNAGACINETDCEDQIYFPSDAVPFTTLFHTEFYYPDSTEFFTESNYFSSSFDFTQSTQFSESNDFTKSSMFSQTNDFTKSDLFSESDEFTKSNFFSKSDDFTKSNEFLKTSDFTKSDPFSKTKDFTKSSLFSESFIFSKSSGFTKSDIFKPLTKSNSFSPSQSSLPKTQDNVTIIIENNDSKSHAMEIGIGVGAGGLALIGAIIGFFIWKNKKPLPKVSENETYELTEDTTNSVVTDNDLNKIMEEDDPFAEEFEA